MIKIKNLPIPAPSRAEMSSEFDQLEPGETLLIPLDAKTSKQITGALSNYKRRHPERKFTTRTLTAPLPHMEDYSLQYPVLGVWRTE